MIVPLIRFTFGVYAGGLFMATHWPSAKVDFGVPRSDLWLHIAIFAGWALLLIACGVWGAPASGRNVVWSVISSLLYAAMDEVLQGIPYLHREVALDDYAANASGILVAAGIALLLGKLVPSLARERTWQEIAS